METRNEPPLFSLWILSTVGLCMILLPCLKVYPVGSNHNFSHAILQNWGSFQSTSHVLGDFWSCTEKCYGCRNTFLSPATNTWEPSHEQSPPKDFLPSTDNTTMRDTIQATTKSLLVTATTYQSRHGTNLSVSPSAGKKE